jgi:cyclophilin family peptidyl-prolyl cis-trans isomerase
MIKILLIIIGIILLLFYFNGCFDEFTVIKKNNIPVKTSIPVNKVKDDNKPIINNIKPIIKNKPKEDLVFLKISNNNKLIGKITIKLFSDVVPITSKNFRTLCQNKTYSNSPLHRIISNFMIQGGDYTNGDGTGGKSIYGDTFKDENFNIKHDRPYLLSMANCGTDTNGSQFFITTAPTPHLDGKHVVFGEVIDGFDTVDYLNNVQTGPNDRPEDDIRIMDCGSV